MAAETTVTREGQVTIPVGVRRALDLREGDRLLVERQGEAAVLRRAPGVVALTAGILARYRRPVPLTAEVERGAFGQAVADEVAGAAGA